jgi:hypothetical protein
MASFLHLLKADSPSLAASVIESNARAPDAGVTVVLLGGFPPPAVPTTVSVRRLAPDDLDYAQLLDLIFASDHVVTW